jgi:pyridoxine/pyridoxamine 5'-phosphate oxidase
MLIEDGKACLDTQVAGVVFVANLEVKTGHEPASTPWVVHYIHWHRAKPNTPPWGDAGSLALRYMTQRKRT